MTENSNGKCEKCGGALGPNHAVCPDCGECLWFDLFPYEQKILEDEGCCLSCSLDRKLEAVAAHLKERGFLSEHG